MRRSAGAGTALCILAAGFFLASPFLALASGILDPALERWTAPGRETAPALRSATGTGYVEVFLQGDPDLSRLADLGVRLRTRAGPVWTAAVPVPVVSRLEEVTGLERVVLGRPVERLLDLSVPSVRADGLRDRSGEEWSGLTGNDVLVGIVDSGVDVTHDDFRRPDGSTRVLFYWDQRDSAGPPPRTAGGDTLYTFGTERSALDIDSGNPPSGDPVGHGTHVAGAAVGNGRGSAVDSLRHRYAGLAPEADIVVVALDTFLETGVLDAVNYVFAKATDLGKPAVVNLSLGSQFGPHDGTTPLEVGINNLVGPGRLVVAAAGNEAEDRIHAELHVPAGGSDSASVFIPAYQPDPFFNFFVVDAFYRDTDSLAVTVVTPSGARFGPYAMDARVEELTGEGTLFLAHLESTSGNRQVQFDISDFDPDPTGPGSPAEPASGEWWVVFRDLSGVPGGGEVDLWIPQASMVDFAGNGPLVLTGHDPGEEIAVPASADRVIAVGSYNTKRCWKDSTGADQCSSVPDTLAGVGMVTFFSSRGPTRDGREKPEVVAPGFVISSSRSHQMSADQQAAYRLGRTLDPDREHFVFAGTSMAAPHVAGALALLLQNVPGLTPEAAQDRLRTTSREDPNTGTTWNPGAGYGKLDVAALVDSVVAVGVREVLLSETGSGTVTVSWSAAVSDPVVFFELSRIVPGERSVTVAGFAGRGPHSWSDPDPRPGTVYEVTGWFRTGERIPWGRVVWRGFGHGGLRVSPPHPNPFRARTVIPVRVAPSPGSTPRVWVLDTQGRRVRSLAWRAGDPDGWSRVAWDGRDDDGRLVAAGTYWIYIRAGEAETRSRVVRLP